MTRSQTGATLPLVLVMLAILGIMTTSIASGATQELRMAQANLRSSQAFYAAIAGIQQIAARCEAVGAGNPGCGTTVDHDLLSSSQSAYQIRWWDCSSNNVPGCAGANLPAIVVSSIGCTGITTNLSAPCSTTSLRQGRRVVRAVMEVKTLGNGTHKVNLQLLP